MDIPHSLPFDWSLISSCFTFMIASIRSFELFRRMHGYHAFIAIRLEIRLFYLYYSIVTAFELFRRMHEYPAFIAIRLDIRLFYLYSF